MGLLERLLTGDPIGENKIPILVFTAYFFEVRRGFRTNAEFAAAFGGFTGPESAALVAIDAQITAGTMDKSELEDILRLGETLDDLLVSPAPYYSKATVKTRLGL